MHRQIHDFFLRQSAAGCLHNIFCNLYTALIFPGVFPLHQQGQLSVLTGKQLLSVYPLYQKLNMCHKTFIMQGRFIQQYSQITFHNIHDCLHLIRKLHCIPDICTIFCIYEMKGNKSSFILRQKNIKSVLDQLQCINS